MDLVTNFLFLVLFGIVGFITSKICGINPAKIYSDIGSAIIILPLVFLMFPAIVDPNNALTMLEKIPNFFVNALPGAIIGDAVGTVVASITGEK